MQEYVKIKRFSKIFENKEIFMRKNLSGLKAILMAGVLIIGLSQYAIAQVNIDDVKNTVISWADQNSEHISGISHQIWEFAEIGLTEFKSSDLLVGELERNGFSMERGVAGMPTSFVGSYVHGSGKPIIGILAEYDALPNGHSCGHNLFGAGSVSAAIAMKEAMEKHDIDGTVKLFGTPTEDTHGGKVWMAREGVFDGCDVFLSWHPGTQNDCNYGSNLAVQILEIDYTGVSAHAAAAPEKGRSALDGLTISSIAMEFLREHMIEPMRVQYIITNGGQAPNSVPEFAQMRLVIRGPLMKDIDELRSREGGIDDCIRAGALASGTDVTMQVVGAFYNKIPNKTGSYLIIENMEYVGAPIFTDEENQFVQSLAEKYNMPLGKLDSSIHEPVDDTGKASADTGDVSYIAPLISFNTATEAPGTPGHSSAKNEQVGMSIGWKGAIFATKVLACAGVDLLRDQEKLAAVQAEFQERMVGIDYHPVIPADLWPPIPKENPVDFKGPAVPNLPEAQKPQSLLYWK